jgi:hypothetical protein
MKSIGLFYTALVLTVLFSYLFPNKALASRVLGCPSAARVARLGRGDDHRSHARTPTCIFTPL